MGIIEVYGHALASYPTTRGADKLTINTFIVYAERSLHKILLCVSRLFDIFSTYKAFITPPDDSHPALQTSYFINTVQCVALYL